MPKKPLINRAIFKYIGVGENRISNQLAIIGTVKNRIGFLRPKFAAVYPKVRLAKIPAAAPRAAAQDAWSIVIFPLAKGLSSDIKIIAAGEVQPS